ncbi:hypothetical protein GQ43DRAFT_22990 [Delitschia confertaspora ATCC 74209]|uniref:WSC domain-containing protein n=1 Tax=Delitschia confertaspora ATCC 74209 TaxID=1513339 RepID=A0A9P4JNY9_9PLEO|nr:hypothetical protein GQ43DRAFT_22990 [Delitschia confertaspora ATCC 74209]
MTRFNRFTGLLALILFAAVWLASPVTADIEYCSSENTGAGNEELLHIYQSNGWCHDQCRTYAFGIVQGKSCWCSDWIPAKQADTGACNSDCPGYPDEKCGNPDKHLYGYIAIGNKPSGTQGAPVLVSPSPQSRSCFGNPSSISTSTHASASSFPSISTFSTSFLRSFSLSSSSLLDLSWSIASTFVPIASSTSPAPQRTTVQASAPDPKTVIRTSVIVITPVITSDTSQSQAPTTRTIPPLTTLKSTTSDSKPSEDSSTPSSPSTRSTSNASTLPPTPIIETVTLSGSVIERTITPPSVPTSQNSNKGLSGGAIAGVVVGGLAALAAIVCAGLGFLWWKKKHNGDPEDPSITRNPSTLSRTGLLGGPTINTAVGAQISTNPLGSDSTTPKSGHRSSILRPDLALAHPNVSRSSFNTINDNEDYSRPLNVRNPDPEPEDE